MMKAVLLACSAGSRSPGAALGPVHNGTATAFGGPQVLASYGRISRCSAVCLGLAAVPCQVQNFTCLVRVACASSMLISFRRQLASVR